MDKKLCPISFARSGKFDPYIFLTQSAPEKPSELIKNFLNITVSPCVFTFYHLYTTKQIADDCGDRIIMFLIPQS